MLRILSLNGTWTLFDATEPMTTQTANVPGCVHVDLIRAGRLDDPFWRDNETQQRMIGESDWVLVRSFEVDDALLDSDRIVLRCDGIDTLSDIYINGVQIATTDNMFRIWEIDLRQRLIIGTNILTVHIKAPLSYQRNRERTDGILPAWGVGQMRVSSGSYLRKAAYNFGWDWGPAFVTSGIWRSIAIITYNNARLREVAVTQTHTPDAVNLTVTLGIDHVRPIDLLATISVRYDGAIVAQARGVPIVDSALVVDLPISNPRLWWVNGMGAQPLYSISVELISGDGDLLDTWQRRVGLRELRLERHADTIGESFAFSINGVPFFAKGANWIPLDPFPTRVKRARYERLVASAAAVHMNMLRVWGGGIYENDDFYDLCDEYGIAVWQDFMFACGAYPTRDPQWMASVQAEAEDTLRRLRHHPCIALWCGNNEIEQGLVGDQWTGNMMSWADYRPLFDDLLPRLVAQLDPGRDYWNASPHKSIGDRADHMNPTNGDAHLWAVWHGGEPFEWYRSARHRFISEFGFQSFPHPRTLSRALDEEDMRLDSPIMTFRQRSAIGNQAIAAMMADWFGVPTAFDSFIWLSQLLQGMAIKIAVEGWRVAMPVTMGALYWQLNDVWQAPSWSSIDYHGAWKALHYMARRFFAPQLIAAFERPADFVVDLCVVNDGDTPHPAVLAWTATNVGGDVLATGELPLTLPVRGSVRAGVCDLSALRATYDAADLLVWVDLVVEDRVVASDLVLLARPRDLHLPTPTLRTRVTPTPDGIVVTLTTDRPALWVWIEAIDHDAQPDDNFIHLRPGHTATLDLMGVSADAPLRVRSLVDLMPPSSQ